MFASRECDLARAIRAIETRSSALAGAIDAEAASDVNEAADATTDATLRKLEQSVNEAKRALLALASDDGQRMKDERRISYVDAIERAERELSAARDRRDALVSARRGASGATTSGKTVEDSPHRWSQRTPVPLGRSATLTVNATNATKVTRRAPIKLTADDESELRRQRAIQEGLTDEMTELASGLKANALALERGLGRSTAMLEEIETRLERNVAGARQTTRRQTAAYRANRRGSCWTWMILALVGVLFAWTYVAIKVSSDRTKINSKK